MQVDPDSRPNDQEAIVWRAGTLKILHPPDRAANLLAKHFNRTVLHLLELDRQHRFLHLGGGQGDLLGNVDADVKIGVDHSPERLEAAQKALKNHVELILAPFDALPFPDSHFDRVLLCEDLERMQDPARVLAEVRRVLAHNGLAVVAFNRSELLDELSGWLDRLRFVGLLSTGRLGRYLLPRRVRRAFLRGMLTDQRLTQLTQDHFRLRRVAGIPPRPYSVTVVAQLVPN